MGARSPSSGYVMIMFMGFTLDSDGKYMRTMTGKMDSATSRPCVFLGLSYCFSMLGIYKFLKGAVLSAKSY